jgi:hypothetical protein
MMEFDNLSKRMIGLAFECVITILFQTKTLRVLRGKKILILKG